MMAFCLLAFRKFKSGITIFLITLSLLLIDSVGIFSAILLSHLEKYPVLVQPLWAKNNAIVVLGAGTVTLHHKKIIKPTIAAYSRIFEAAKLYNSCKKTNQRCTIIISGGDVQHHGKTEAEVYQAELNDIGINSADIILEPHSKNTFQNAEFTSVILKANQYDNIIMDTSSIHMRRALLYFSYFGINAFPAVADYLKPKLFSYNFGYNIVVTDYAVHEYIGILRFYIYNDLGLNSPTTSTKSP